MQMAVGKSNADNQTTYWSSGALLFCRSAWVCHAFGHSQVEINPTLTQTTVVTGKEQWMDSRRVVAGGSSEVLLFNSRLIHKKGIVFSVHLPKTRTCAAVGSIPPAP